MYLPSYLLITCFTPCFCSSLTVGVFIGLLDILYKSYPFLISAAFNSFLMEGTALVRSTRDLGNEFARKEAILLDKSTLVNLSNPVNGFRFIRFANGFTKCDTPKLSVFSSPVSLGMLLRFNNPSLARSKNPPPVDTAALLLLLLLLLLLFTTGHVLGT